MLTNVLDPNLSSCADLEILLGMAQSEYSTQAVNALLELGCKVYPAKNPEDALAKLQFHSFPVVILEEGYSMPIMQLMACLPMAIRRNIFYVMIGQNLETGNAMQGFVLSANYVISFNDLNKFGQIFQSSLFNNNRFYRPMQYATEKISKEQAS